MVTIKSIRLRINQVEDISLVEEEVRSEDLNANECLIRSEVSLISAGTELSRVFGLKQGAVYPVDPGYCSVGTILQTGKGVSHVKSGDVVLFSGPHASLQRYDPEKSDGGVLYKLRENTSLVDGAYLMMCSIAMNGILPADVKCTDRVAVLGMGTLGMITALLYQQMGVEVIAVEPVKHRAKMAAASGIKKVVSCAPDQQVTEIQKLTGGLGADIVVDASGNAACIETGIQIAAKYGQVLLLGSPRTPYETNMTGTLNAIHMKMLQVVGCFNRRYPQQEKEGSRLSITRNMQYLEQLLQQKIIDTDAFVSHIIAPDEAQIMQAYQGLMYDKEHYTGVIIDWRKEGSLCALEL